MTDIRDCGLKELYYLTSLIEQESKDQIEKWGYQNRHIFEWAMWATEEFGEFIQKINEYNYGRSDDKHEIVKEGIQTVTLILKMLEGLLFD